VENKQLRPGEIVLFVSGAVALIASFLPWVDLNGFTANSWDMDLWFPVSTFVPLSAVVAAALLAVEKFADVRVPEVLGYTPALLMRTFAIFGALLALGWIIAIEDAGIGFWLSVLATFGATVGVVMLEREPVDSTGRSRSV
jgi:hypothetical protein